MAVAVATLLGERRLRARGLAGRPARPGRHRLPQRPPPALRRLDRVRHGRPLHRRRADGYGEDPDYFGRSQRLGGLLLDRGFGLAAWMPAYLLAVPALAALARRRPAGWWTPGGAARRRLGHGDVGGPHHARLVVARPPGGGRGSLPGARRRLVGRPGADGAGLRRGGRGVRGAGLGLAGGRGARSPAHADLRLRVDGQPVVSGVAPVLPDYRHPDAGDWVLQAAWFVALAAVAVLALHVSRSRTSLRASASARASRSHGRSAGPRRLGLRRSPRPAPPRRP